MSDTPAPPSAPIFSCRGMLFRLPRRYAKGAHLLTAAEAEVLDDHRRARIAAHLNVSAPRDASVEEMTKLLEEIVSRWTFEHKRRRRRETPEKVLAEAYARAEGLDPTHPLIQQRVQERLAINAGVAADFLSGGTLP